MGERFKQARELKGMTQTELAKNLDVDPSLIAQIESGYKQPSEQLLKLMVFQTGFPPRFFRSELIADFPFGSLALRSHTSILTKRDKVRAYRHAQLIYEMTETFAKSVSQIKVHLPRLDEKPAEAAHVVRSEFGLSPDKPIINLLNVLEKAGVLIFPLPISVPGLNAFSLWASSMERPIIALSDGKSADNVRFSLGHELYHLIAPPKGTPREIERKANYFSAEFLMPEIAMREELDRAITLTLLAELKAKWRVSIQALARRAHELRFLTARQYYYLMKQIGFRGWRTKEPVEIPTERPRALRKMAELLYGSPINFRKLASDLGFPTFLVKDIFRPYYENGLAA